jgi:hypothetical protein
MFPEFSITLATSWNQPAFNAGILSSNAGFLNALPKAKSKPAAG